MSTVTTLVETTPLKQVRTVEDLLKNRLAGQRLAAVAATHMSPERLMRIVALSISQTPKLAQCTPLSLLGCMMTTAALGLEPNTPLQHAYIIPFLNSKMVDGRRVKLLEATWIPGYRGYIQLGYNSGQIAGIDAGIHYDDDEHWRHLKGARGTLEHIPGPEQGKKEHAYAEVALKDGGLIRVVWPWAKVLAHRDRYSQGYRTAVQYGKTDNPWQTNEDVMAMKTMIRQLAKFMPMSTERLVQAARLDGARADYAGWATSANPAGSMPEILGGEDARSEVDLLEEDEEEDEGAPDASEPSEERRKPGPSPARGAPAPTAPRSPAPARSTRKPSSSDQGLPLEPQDDPGSAAPARGQAKALPTFDAVVAQMRADLSTWRIDDLQNFEDLYAPELHKIKAANPDLYYQLAREIEDRRADDS